uniref:Uncharacterized protein n=1 Tax=Caenorhabditis japonica TaxID=281687 RepID=A0A8R1IV96_CAEJA
MLSIVLTMNVISYAEETFGLPKDPIKAFLDTSSPDIPTPSDNATAAERSVTCVCAHPRCAFSSRTTRPLSFR